VPAGLGDAVRVGAAAVGGEPFAVLLPDEILLSGARVLRRMVDAFHRAGERSVSLMEVDLSEIGGYGCAAVAPSPIASEQWRITGCVEKPEPSRAPSCFALSGRYVLGPEAVEFLDATPPDQKGEIQLTSALHEQAVGGQLSGFVVRPDDGRVDVGNWRGWLAANVRAFAEHAPTAALTGAVVS
jgi:UTP--glucose-1-phosphate uridylyltransferase